MEKSGQLLRYDALNYWKKHDDLSLFITYYSDNAK